MKKYCPNCGSQSDDNNEFCIQCGCKLQEQTQNENIPNNINQINEKKNNIIKIVIIISIISITLIMFNFNKIVSGFIILIFLIVLTDKKNIQPKIRHKRNTTFFSTSFVIISIFVMISTFFIFKNLAQNKSKINDVIKDTSYSQTSDEKIFKKVSNYTKPTISAKPVAGEFICTNNDLPNIEERRLDIRIYENYIYRIYNENSLEEGAYKYSEVDSDDQNIKTYSIELYPIKATYNEKIITNFYYENNQRKGTMSYVKIDNTINEYICEEDIY